MIVLILIGLLSGLFFSSTFILNRIMSLEGGHWVWSASLRYAYMIVLLILITPIFQGIRVPGRLFHIYIKHWKFWTIAGGIGFGGFYSLICFSADHAPGWVVATTWQLTIIATLFVLLFFGRSFDKRIWLFSSIVFLGVLLVNVSHAELADPKELFLGGFPVLLAAFCYPTGNQMVWEAKHGNKRLPKIDDPLLENPFNKVLLLSLGSVPFWLILVAIIHPPIPSKGQLINSALVAVFSGILATSLFLFARNKATKASELAAVDATQSSEVIFALGGEIVLLHAPFPGTMALGGIVIIFFGLGLFVLFQKTGEA